MDAVKLEGGKIRAETVKKLSDSGIAVMGHVGLTPQGISVLGIPPISSGILKLKISL